MILEILPMKPVVTHLFADEVVATLRQTLGKLPRGDGKLPANRAGVSEATMMPAATEAGTKKT